MVIWTPLRAQLLVITVHIQLWGPNELALGHCLHGAAVVGAGAADAGRLFEQPGAVERSGAKHSHRKRAGGNCH